MSGPVAIDEKMFVAAARNSGGEKGSRKRNETLQGTWFGRALKDSLCFCYAGSLSGGQKSKISVSRLPERRAVGEIRRGRKTSNRTEKRIHRFRVKVRRET